MKITRRLFLLSPAVLAGLGVSCAKKTGQVKVGVVTNMPAEFWSICEKGAKDAGEKYGLVTIGEVFADRGYLDDGTLAPRDQPGGMIEEAEKSVAQVLSMVDEGVVVSLSGKRVPVSAGTLCLHGDQPGAVAFATALRRTFSARDISLVAP